MTIMRASATTIESFRLWRDPEQAWMSEADLLATIRGEFTPNRGILIGQAFGKILENPDKYRVSGGYRTKHWPLVEDGEKKWLAFHFSDATMAGPLAIAVRHGVYEAKAQKQYGDVLIVSKADMLVGADLHEFKTTLNSFDAEKYAVSSQWRFMASAFQPRRITYHVFLLREGKGSEAGVVVGELRDIETMPLYPYAELDRDCADLARDFAAYVTQRGLDGMLRERQARVDLGLPYQPAA